MKGLLAKILVCGVLGFATLMAYGGSFHGWFLPKPLDKPVSLKDGSKRAGGYGLGLFFLGRSHRGGGFRGGK